MRGGEYPIEEAQEGLLDFDDVVSPLGPLFEVLDQAHAHAARQNKQQLQRAHVPRVHPAFQACQELNNKEFQ
jgi:hypothetical protein